MTRRDSSPHPAGVTRRGAMATATATAWGLFALAGPARAATSAVVVQSEGRALAGLVDPAAVARIVYASGRWCEGPVWSPADGGLVFSDVRADRLICLRADRSAEVLRDPSNNGNGNALDRQGRLLSCEHRGRALVRREAGGRWTVLADRHEGRRLNSPNDVAVSADGAIWFTDPVFGITQPDEGLQAEPEQRARNVFRLGADGRLTVASDSFDQPNGIAFSPDFRTLYVSEAGAALDPDGGGREIRAFDVADDGRLRRERVFARLGTGVPDGLKTDETGCVHAATADGIRIWSAAGEAVGAIRTASVCGNLAFGGADGRTLFICNGANVLALPMRVRGAAWARNP